MSKSNTTIYFPGLNGIRALAAMIVIVWHIDQYFKLFHLTCWGFNANGMSGHGVDMFFVLSGFLITYLLLVEKQTTKNINVRNFYIRRILRIWPLYYLSIGITLILVFCKVVPAPDEWTTTLFFFIFFMANIGYAFGNTISSITPLWSVGVEEQFYLIWPNLIKKLKKPIWGFIIVITAYFILKLTIWKIDRSSNLYALITDLRINIMALGGIGAYLIHTNRQSFLNLIYSKPVQFVAWGLLFISLIHQPIHIFSFIDHEVNSLIYLVLIMNVSNNPNPLISLEYSFFNHLGKISYGLYVYHMSVIYLLSHFLKEYTVQDDYWTKLFVGILVIFCTYAFSLVSYRYFEVPILKLKHRFTSIYSTNQANNGTM